jgi:homoserine O-acetyltransferase
MVTKNLAQKILGFVALATGMSAPAALAQPAQNGQPASASQGAPWEIAANPLAKQQDAIFDRYQFRNGQTLPRLKLHYATLGEAHRNAAGDIDNAVLVLHWTGASGATLLSPTYMKALFDQGRPLDYHRYYLIFPDNLGHGQSSKPSDGLHARFPHYGYGDLVDLQHRLVVEKLGIKHLRLILGMSMGGMNVWQWAEAYPDAMDAVMPVVSLPIAVSGRNLLWRRMVSEQIRNDPEWRGGDYTKGPQGWLHAYEVLRMMIDGVPHLQATIPTVQSADADIKSTQAQAKTTDANDILYSIESSLDYNPEPGLNKIKARLFVLNFTDDEFNPDELGALERLTPTIKGARYVVQKGTPDSFGHLTMAHPDLWADHVATFMKELDDPHDH